MAPAWGGDQWALQGALPTARTAVRAQRAAAGRAHRPSGHARDAPVPQGLPCDPQCTRRRCGERPEYLATTQVHLYGAGTNGRPVQQRYTLTGSACIGPPKGKHRKMGPEPASSTPPPHPGPGSPEASTWGETPKATEPEGGGGEHARGQGEATVSCNVSCNMQPALGLRDGPPRAFPLPHVIHSSPSLR